MPIYRLGDCGKTRKPIQISKIPRFTPFLVPQASKCDQNSLTQKIMLARLKPLNVVIGTKKFTQIFFVTYYYSIATAHGSAISYAHTNDPEESVVIADCGETQQPETLAQSLQEHVFGGEFRLQSRLRAHGQHRVCALISQQQIDVSQ